MNIVTVREITIQDWVPMVARRTRFAGDIRWNPIQPGSHLCLDVPRAKREIGLVAYTLFENSFRPTIPWYE